MIPLRDIVSHLRALAPLELAADWDNVGLLLEPESDRAIQRVLLTIDLTHRVLDEAFASGVQLVLAYHPPIFQPLRRLTLGSPREHLVVRALAAGLAVYSPHTALDAVAGGVNDWLADGLGPGTRVSLEPPRADAAPGVTGQGREVCLAEPPELDVLTTRIKTYLGLRHVRLAAAPRHRQGEPVARVLLCPGAGGSLLSGRPGDLYLTGEMRHHDVLAAVERGTSVILTDHTHCERGYLPTLQKRLRERLGSGIDIRISQVDTDPLQVV